MARLRGILMIGGLLTALLLAPRAEAADGRITFTGMIVEPTCTIGPDHMAQLASAAGAQSAAGFRVSCGQGPHADTASRYELAMSTLMAGRQTDQLLSYFAGNAQASGATARLVTQTYE